MNQDPWSSVTHLLNAQEAIFISCCRVRNDEWELEPEVEDKIRDIIDKDLHICFTRFDISTGEKLGKEGRINIRSHDSASYWWKY